MDRLSVLVLHCLGDPALASVFLNHHVFALRNNCPDHDYLYHDATLPIPPYVAEQEFDAILLDVSFLWARWVSREFLQARKDAYAFVAASPAVKLAYPQDEYDCNVLLDDWMCEWKVDVVFSVIASGWDVLYPRYRAHGEIRLGYTGYVDESLIDRSTTPFHARKIDIGYRAKRLPPHFGRTGETKWAIGRDVAMLGRQAGLNVDIELGDAGTLYGDKWLDFIDSSRFTLGANSGSSLLDPHGDIRRRVRAYVASHPEACFEEVEAVCFPGMDGKHVFTAISPRVLEAALLRSAQILVDGEYSGIVKPFEHFIPIRQDASNFREVRHAMSDATEVQAMIERCRDAVLGVNALRYSNKARMTLELIGDLATRRGLSTNGAKARLAIARYQTEMPPRYASHWRVQRLRMRAMRALSPFPLVLDALRFMSRVAR